MDCRGRIGCSSFKKSTIPISHLSLTNFLTLYHTPRKIRLKMKTYIQAYLLSPYSRKGKVGSLCGKALLLSALWKSLESAIGHEQDERAKLRDTMRSIWWNNNHSTELSKPYGHVASHRVVAFTFSEAVRLVLWCAWRKIRTSNPSKLYNQNESNSKTNFDINS